MSILGGGYNCNRCGRYNRGSVICFCSNKEEPEVMNVPKEDHMASFLKEAFCIDGDSIIYKELTIDGMPSLMFKLTDSKRGIFYVTITKEQ